MSKQGGYFIIDFKGNSLSDTKTEIAGIFDRIEGNKGKAMLLSGLVFGGVEKPDAFATYKVDSGNFVFTVYGYDITITDDDEVTIAEAQSGGGNSATTFYKSGYDLYTEKGGAGTKVTKAIFDEAFAKGPVYIADGGFYENAVLTKMDYEGSYAIYYFDVTAEDNFNTVSIAN